MKQSSSKAPQEENKHNKIIENAKVQLTIVSAIKDQKPIEEVKALLQPHLPKDSLVLLAIHKYYTI